MAEREVGGSAEPVAPPPQDLDPVRIGQRRWAEDLHERIQREREPEPWPDWKAEAYHGELIVRELLDERAEILAALARAPQGGAAPTLWNNSASIEVLYHALGQIKGINSDCERHRNAPWQLQCETCRRFVATELAFQGVRGGASSSGSAPKQGPETTGVGT